MKRFACILAISMLTGLAACGGGGSEQKDEAEKTVKPPSMDLITAVVVNDLDAVRQHIAAGSDLDVTEPSRASTPLITACALGKTDAARLLVEAGASLDYQNKDGSTALHTAAFFCREDIVEMLLDSGIDRTLKNNSGKTALEIVEQPFDMVRPAYDVMGKALKPAGLVLDYDRIEAARPRIAEMLREEP